MSIQNDSKSNRLRTFPGVQAIRNFLKDTRAKIGIIIFTFFSLIAILAPVLTPYNPNDNNFVPLTPPSLQHWLGTTGNGQDVFSQFVWGARTSLSIGLLAGLISTVLSVLIGMYPGYRGGWMDRIFDTITNVFLVIPSLPLIIVISSYVHSAGPWVIVFVIGLTGWAGGARVLRAQTLTYRNRDFISAAKLGGSSELRILVWEIVPNMLSLIISNFMFGTLGAILAEAGLEFLGLGNVSVVSWGTMLYWSDSGGALLMGAWWWLLPEGLAIALFGMSLALMNFGIDQLTNPRLRSDSLNKKKARIKRRESNANI